MSEVKEVKYAVEVVTDKSGKLLWMGMYELSRIHGPGEMFIRNSIRYRVVKSGLVRGKISAALVEHVVYQIG